MKKIFCILCCFLILFPFIIKTGLFVWYKVNQNYISEVLCINKSKLELRCKGCCVLNTKLKQTEQPKEKNETNLPVLKSEREWNWLALVYEFKQNPETGMQHYFGIYKCCFSAQCLKKIFHPPSSF